MDNIRLFKNDGVQKFEDYLEKLQIEGNEKFPVDILFDDSLSLELDPPVQIKKQIFKGKLETGKYLSKLLTSIELSDKFFNVGLWAWLSAYYFDSVCPEQEDGKRLPGQIARHIPPADRNWRRYYRHLLAFPTRTYSFHGDLSKILLIFPLDKMGDFVEQIGSRQELVTNRGIIEALDILYWDEENQQPKRGSRPNQRKLGTLRRFVDVIYQLDLTYDLFSMTGKQIVDLLPEGEFSRWITI